MVKQTKQSFPQRVSIFMDEVKDEIRKATWPDRKSLTRSTIVVMVSVVVLAAYVSLSDGALSFLTKKVIGN